MGCSAWTEEVTWYVTYWHYGSSALWRSCASSKIVKRCSIDSTAQIELSCTKATCRSHRVRSRAGVTCRGHMEGSRAGGMRVAQGDLHLQMGGVIIVQTLQVKRRCQFVVRLKPNKCYQGLLCYLSSYINLLNIRLCGWLQAPGRFQTFSPWSRTLADSGPCLILEVIVIVLVFVWSIGRHHSWLCHIVVLDCLVDCSVRCPIAFGLTEPSVSIVYSLILDFWSFNCSWPIVRPIAQSFAVSPNRYFWSVAQLLLAYCLACCSIIFGFYV